MNVRVIDTALTRRRWMEYRKRWARDDIAYARWLRTHGERKRAAAMLRDAADVRLELMNVVLGRVVLMARDGVYSVGDVIEYRTFDDSIRMVRVTEKHDDVKKGRPGFTGLMVAPSAFPEVWGYDSQVVRVVQSG